MFANLNNDLHLRILCNLLEWRVQNLRFMQKSVFGDAFSTEEEGQSQESQENAPFKFGRLRKPSAPTLTTPTPTPAPTPTPLVPSPTPAASGLTISAPEPLPTLTISDE